MVKHWYLEVKSVIFFLEWREYIHVSNSNNAYFCFFFKKELEENARDFCKQLLTTKVSQKLYIIINILNENLVFQICRTTGRVGMGLDIVFASHNITTCIQRPPKID